MSDPMPAIRSILGMPPDDGTPARRIKAAIGWLEFLRGMRPENGDREWRERGRSIVAHDGTMVARDVLRFDRNMILTLHRTIDAQLAILRRNRKIGDMREPEFRNALALADAILGSDS